MQRATLYLMVGFPGSGKTTTAKVIRDLTGAVHIWADHQRKAMFGKPTHSLEESHQLYEHLNELAAEHLKQQRSVVYDTSFNFLKDRQRMREIAARLEAPVVLVWVQTPKELAYERASIDSHKQPTRVLGDIPRHEFERMTSNLERPLPNENPVILDGTQITPHYVARELGLAEPVV